MKRKRIIFIILKRNLPKCKHFHICFSLNTRIFILYRNNWLMDNEIRIINILP